MAKRFSLIAGIIIFLAGVFAFVPNPLVGPNGVFLSNTISGVIDLIIGAILIYSAYGTTEKIAKTVRVLSVIAIVAAALCFFLGASTGSGSLLGAAYNTADCFVCLIAGILGFIFAEKVVPTVVK